MAAPCPEVGWHEPYESRGSRADLWGPEGEIPSGYPARSRTEVVRWPSAVAVQAEAANHPELLRSRAVVVSVVGKVAP